MSRMKNNNNSKKKTKDFSDLDGIGSPTSGSHRTRIVAGREQDYDMDTPSMG